MATPTPSPADVLPIRLRTQSDQRLVRPSRADLAALVERIGGEADHFLVLEPIPHRPRVFIQVYRDDASDYIVDHRDGGLDQYAAVLADAEAVLRVLHDWSTQDPGWSHGVDWKLSYRHPAVEVTPLSPAAERAATALARRFLVEGYADFETMAQDISELADTDPAVTIEQAEALLEPLWLARVAEQRTWPEVTDADRVDAALAQLAAAGIRARPHFDHAVPGELYLSVDTATDAAAVDAALTDRGLTTRWDGTAVQPIAVVGLDWRKRLR